MKNILAFGTCRLGFNLNKYNLNRPTNLDFINNHNEILNVINNQNKTNYDNYILSEYSKIKKLDKDTKNNLLKQIKCSDIILLELCSKKTYYEYENNEYKIISKIYYESMEGNIITSNYIKFSNTSQTRDSTVKSNFFRIDNINLLEKDLFNNINISNYLKNKEFYELIYNKESKESILKIVNMPNNYFFTIGICFDTSNINKRLFTVKLNISSNSTKDIYIKYYNGNKYIYTDQKVNEPIILKNIKKNYKIGFYRINNKGEVMSSNMLKEINEFYWNINFNIKSYEIIINKLDKIDDKFPKKFYVYEEPDNKFIENFNNFLNYFKNKKIVVIPNVAIKNNNQEIIPQYVNRKRLKYINFLKEILLKIPNCYFFENYVTNDLLQDKNHYNELGYKIVGEKLEQFLDNL